MNHRDKTLLTVCVGLTGGFLVIAGLLTALTAEAKLSPALLINSEPLDILEPIQPDVRLRMPEPAFVPTAGQRLPNAIIPIGDETKITTTAQPADCVTPDFENDMSVMVGANETVQLCPGTYTVPENFVPWQVVYIWGNNATIDCNGATLIGRDPNQYPYSYEPWKNMGIFSASWADNVTIKNCNISNFSYGIFAGGGYDSNTNLPGDPKKVSIHDNTFFDYSFLPIILSSAIDSDVFNNIRTDGDPDYNFHNPIIKLEFTSNSRVYGNTLELDKGISLSFNSNNNQVFGNIVGNVSQQMSSWDPLIAVDRGSAYNELFNNTMIHNPLVAVTFFQVDGDYTYDNYANTGGAHHNYIHDNTADNMGIGFMLKNAVHDNIILNNNFGVFPTYGTGYQLTQGENRPDLVPYDNRIEHNRFQFGDSPYISFAFNSIAGSTNNVTVGNYFNGKPLNGFDLGSNIYDENNQGNYWTYFNDPADGCYDVDYNGICDNPLKMSPSQSTGQDNYPISSVPIIEPITNQAIHEGQTLVLTVHATDPAETITTLSASYPNGTFGASFTDNGDNTGTFTWKPWYNQAGTAYEVVFSASNEIYTVEKTVLIDVSNYTVPPPTVTLETSTQTAVAGQPFTLTVSGSSEEALASVWWGVREPGNYAYDVILGSVDGVPVNLAPAQGFGSCAGQTYCEYTKTVIIDEPGDYEIWANSRDTIYFSVISEPHQASEGLGIPVIEFNVSYVLSKLLQINSFY
ncbi:MAG: hypothetical protein WC544_03955 [Patescibacteria group bacterium]